MTIKQVTIDNKVYFEAYVNLRSRVNPNVRAQKRTTMISSLRAAQAIEKDLIREASAELAKREGTDSPWSEVLEKWYEAHELRKAGTKIMQANTVLELFETLRRFTSKWLDLSCQDLTPGHVREVISSMEAAGYSRSRMKAVKSGVNVVFRWGIEERLIRNVHSSPANGVVLSRNVEEKPPAILSLDEIQKLLEEAKAIDSEWYHIWAMALNSGMRSGELFALKWTDIDLPNKLVTVSKSYNRRLRGTKSTKAGYWRKVPINVEMEQLLAELRLITGDTEHVLPRLKTWERGEGARILREFCQGIKIQPIHFHALRACFATHLLNAGVSSPKVKKICGWTDEKVMGRYIRLAGIDVAGATEGLGFKTPTREGGSVVEISGFRTARSRFDNR